MELWNQIFWISLFEMTLSDKNNFNLRHVHFRSYITLLSQGVDHEECQMGQSSSHCCVVSDQGAGLWAPVGVTFVPFSTAPSALCWALSLCTPGISLPSPTSVFLRVSTNTLPSLYTCLCKPTVPPVHTRVCPAASPQSVSSYTSSHTPPKMFLPSVSPVLRGSPSFLNRCEPEHTGLPCLAAVWGALGYL